MLQKERRVRLRKLNWELKRCMFSKTIKKSTYKQILKNALKYTRVLKKIETELNDEKEKLKLSNFRLKILKILENKFQKK